MSWPSLDELGVTVEEALHRIGLRGSWSIDGQGDQLRLEWVTAGQRGNPLAPQAVATGSDLAVLVARVLAWTEPERGGLDWTVPWCLREKARAAEYRRRADERARVRRLYECEVRNLERLGWAWRRAEGRTNAARQHRIAEARRILA